MIKKNIRKLLFVKEQYKHLDQNNKRIWNFRDIGHTMRQIAEGRASQKRILILLRETAGMTQKKTDSAAGGAAALGQRGAQQAGAGRLDFTDLQ